MNKQELKDLTYKMVEERVNKGVELFNSFVFFPVLYGELKKEVFERILRHVQKRCFRYLHSLSRLEGT